MAKGPRTIHLCCPVATQRLRVRWSSRFRSPDFRRWSKFLLALLIVVLLPFLLLNRPVSAVTNPPVLVSQPTSTRAIAIDSLSFTSEPFALNSPYAAVSDRRTRVMLFALNLQLQPGENLSAVTADAEDATHQHYDLAVEYVGPVPQQEWLSAVVLRLNDNLGDVGDVLVRVSYRGVNSNRVRVGIGHVGGGPPDDNGAGPTLAPPYTLSGEITLDGVGLGDVSVQLSGTQSGAFITNAGGLYTFVATAAGEFTIAPTKLYYNFNPPSASFNLSNHRSNINFSATRQTYAITGQVRDDNNNQPLDGVAVTLANESDGTNRTSLTTSGGNYSFAAVPAGYRFTVAPSANAHFTFSSQSIDPLVSDHTLNFQATRRAYSITGRLTGALGNGVVAGATVNLHGLRELSTTTDQSGNYSFVGLPAGGNYSVDVPTTTYYTFTPQSFNDLSANRAGDFAGTLRYYLVSGSVHLGPNSAPGLVVPIAGTQVTTVTTDANGNYSILLPAGGDYTLTPSLQYYDFEPVSQFVSDLRSDQFNRQFTGTRQSFTISGKLLDQQGNSLSGMTVALSGAPEPRVSVTDGAGRYQFTQLTAGFDYTVTPASTAVYVFAPRTFVALGRNETFDFIGLRRFALSGRVRDQSGHGLGGIKVSLTGSLSDAVLTALDGSYSLTATATGNYLVTPSVGQDWFTFAPAAAQFDNLSGAHTTDFTATLAPVPNPGLVVAFDGTPKTVDYGNYWQQGDNLGHFFWEFWAMPGANAGATYLLSDGYGGAHALLFGVGSFNSSEPNRYELLGNLFDGVRFDNYFGSDQGPAIGEWAHLAVGWDGQNIITYYNGVPVGKTPFAGPRFTPGPGGGGGRLLIGGSDHSNFDGRLAEVRGYEDTNPREAQPGGVESSFAPQTVFSREGNLLSYFFRSGQTVADLSGGYRGSNHGGVPRGTLAGILFDCGACPPPQFVIDPAAPNFAANAAPSPVNVPSPPGSPAGALVFDSFSRANSTYLFGSHGGLGTTEGGSAGTQAWQTNQAANGPQPFGILNSIAVLLASDAAVAWVETGSATGNVDVRVDRRRGRWGRGVHTGLSFRVLDSGNYFFAYTTDSGGAPGSQLLNVGYKLGGARVDLANGIVMPANWTTLRVVTNPAGDLDVFADFSLVYSTKKDLLATATGAGLYNNAAGLGLVNRWDNFTVFNGQ
jgi:hypothetical protein